MGANTSNQRKIAGALLLLGFLLVFPAVFINAPGMGENSFWGRRLPFLFDQPGRKYWSVAFAVVTLFGLGILEGVLRQAGDNVFSRIGMVSFTLATAVWLVAIALEVRFGYMADLESFFIILAFPSVLFYGVGILRTRVVPAWVGIAVVVWSALMLMRTLPHNQGPLFYEPALLLVAIVLLVQSDRGR